MVNVNWERLRTEGEKKAAEHVDADGFWPNEDTEEGDVLLGIINRRYMEESDFGPREKLELKTKGGSVIQVTVTKQIERILEVGRSKVGDGIYLSFTGWHEFEVDDGETIRYRKYRGAVVDVTETQDAPGGAATEDDLPF